MSQTNDALVIDEAVQWEAPLRAHESMSTMVWRRFRRHPGAIAGSIVLGIIVLAVILAPLSPYDPIATDIPMTSWLHFSNLLQNFKWIEGIP